MELWIRNQGRNMLIKADCIYLPSPIKIYANDTDYLGTYKTHERALEVLDEIQNLIKNAYVGDSLRVVYEMPEE